MAIIHIQRSIRQVGRIRIGHQVRTNSGKLAPAKLDRFRLSSPQRDPIEHAAALWGGQVAPMDNDRSNDRWQVVTDTDSLRVVIPSTNHFDAWMELWSAAGCDRRCDGERMIVAGGMAADQACMCDPEERECKPTTRLFVVLPDLEALGTWRLETHGHYAASELGAAVELCSIATRNGYSIPARLELEQRTRRTRDERGKPVTRNFAVPVLSVDVSLPQAKAILGQADVATGEITTPTTRQLEPPAPRAIEPPEPTNGAELMARGFAEMEQRKAELPPPPPADIPTPRTHDQYEADQGSEVVTAEQAATLVDVLNGIDDHETRAAAKRDFVARYGRPDQLTVTDYDVALIYAQGLAVAAPPAEVVEQPKLVDTLPNDGTTPITSDGSGRYTSKQQGAFFKLWGEVSQREGWTEDDRHKRILDATGGRTGSWAEVTQLEADQLIRDLKALKQGAA